MFEHDYDDDKTAQLYRVLNARVEGVCEISLEVYREQLDQVIKLVPMQQRLDPEARRELSQCQDNLRETLERMVHILEEASPPH